MPTAFLKSVNEKCGIPLPKLSQLWGDAKNKVVTEYGLDEGSKDFDRLQRGLFTEALGPESAFIEAELQTLSGYHPIITRVHDLTGIPETILRKQWDTLTEVVSYSQGIKREDDEFIPSVLSMFQSKINSLGAQYADALAPSFKRAIEGVGKTAKLKGPAQNTPPIGTNPEALVYWRKVIKTQKKRINQFSEMKEKWAAAILLFKMACEKRGIAPFIDTGVKKAVPDKSPITSYLASYVSPCLETVVKIEKFLSEKKMVGKNVPKKFKLGKIDKTGNTLLLNCSKSWKLLKGEKAASIVVYMIPKFGLRKTEKRGEYKKTCGPNAMLLFSYKKKTDNLLTVTIQLKIRPKMWKGLEDTKKDPKKFLRTWVSRGFKATGSAEKKVLGVNVKFIKEAYNPKDVDEAYALINKMNLGSIVSIGDTDFQIELVKHLLTIVKKFDMQTPALYEEFLRDPDFREYAQEEYATRLPSREDPDSEGYPEGSIMG